jgi:hypothetical protein
VGKLQASASQWQKLGSFIFLELFALSDRGFLATVAMARTLELQGACCVDWKRMRQGNITVGTASSRAI